MFQMEAYFRCFLLSFCLFLLFALFGLAGVMGMCPFVLQVFVNKKDLVDKNSLKV